MAKPYFIFKAHTGIYYAQIRLADGTLSNNKATGCRNRTEAERTVMEWIVTGNISCPCWFKGQQGQEHRQDSFIQ